MNYALSALKRMESVAYSRVIEGEIDLLPATRSPDPTLPNRSPGTQCRSEVHTTCLAEPDTGAQPRACYGCVWRIGRVGPGNGALGQISGY